MQTLSPKNADPQHKYPGNPVPLPPHRPLKEFYGEHVLRAEFVSGLFNRTAKEYDWISSVLSFGSDAWYRRRVLERAGIRPGMKMLDVATGTGLVAEAALTLGMLPQDLIGLDPSQGMLLENRARRSIQLVQGEGERLPFPAGQFDFVVMGYALRHVSDLIRLFLEFERVLKPGGRLVILEITRPRSALAEGLMGYYMRRIFAPWIRWRTGNRECGDLMEYYWETILHCVSPDVILNKLRESGFVGVARNQTGPVLSEYLGVKRGKG